MSTEKVHSGRRKYKPVPDVSRKDPNVSPFDAILAVRNRLYMFQQMRFAFLQTAAVLFLTNQEKLDEFTARIN